MIPVPTREILMGLFHLQTMGMGFIASYEWEQEANKETEQLDSDYARETEEIRAACAWITQVYQVTEEANHE